mmetsp:Transcript_27036/g.68124  ORF Transcript_27036/g.68124 Transcript_27036/m.68124 type:complete len:223 (+) Transcript_27036:902-1570(+)
MLNRVLRNILVVGRFVAFFFFLLLSFLRSIFLLLLFLVRTVGTVAGRHARSRNLAVPLNTGLLVLRQRLQLIGKLFCHSRLHGLEHDIQQLVVPLAELLERFADRFGLLASVPDGVDVVHRLGVLFIIVIIIVIILCVILLIILFIRQHIHHVVVVAHVAPAVVVAHHHLQRQLLVEVAHLPKAGFDLTARSFHRTNARLPAHVRLPPGNLLSDPSVHGVAP